MSPLKDHQKSSKINRDSWPVKFFVAVLGSLLILWIFNLDIGLGSDDRGDFTQIISDKITDLVNNSNLSSTLDFNTSTYELNISGWVSGLTNKTSENISIKTFENDTIEGEGGIIDEEDKGLENESLDLDILYWDLDGFDLEKSEDDRIIGHFVETISSYDIAVLSDIQDPQAFGKICRLLKDHRCLLSAPSGKTIKRSIGVMSKNKVSDIEDLSLGIHSINFEHPPYSFKVGYGRRNIEIIGVYIDKSDVNIELSALDMIYSKRSEDELLMLGTLWADCKMMRNRGDLMNGFIWVIPDDAKTTSTKEDCAYERIIASPKLAPNILHYMIGDKTQPFQSTHEPISIKLRVD